MSTVHLTAPPAAAKTPRARTTSESLSIPPAGATAASAVTDSPRRRKPLSQAVRNVGIVLDTAARVVFLGRDGVKL
ncbi:hypothetical protein OG455_17760 [Kitasatospora sp. NBC_01287]|uniref:hypothetical protein n=1 Tax=Kitasatospora sp. NBC_01287 TaxID=2903573 RepID=UPI00225A7870|nr:hypothetical protein [Kitasatospora sp. NBC_01287]MCX4747345.1 hypothetical protein [Kitasatospora sp. NBC_01287]